MSNERILATGDIADFDFTVVNSLKEVTVDREAQAGAWLRTLICASAQDAAAYIIYYFRLSAQHFVVVADGALFCQHAG